MRPTPARRDRRFLLRILDRHSPVYVEEMLYCQRHSLERGADVADVIDWPLDHLHCDCHYLPGSAATGRCLSSRRSRSISLGCILPYAGLMMRPRSRIANRMMITATLTDPRIAVHHAPSGMPEALRPSMTAAITTI